MKNKVKRQQTLWNLITEHHAQLKDSAAGNFPFDRRLEIEKPLPASVCWNPDCVSSKKNDGCPKTVRCCSVTCGSFVFRLILSNSFSEETEETTHPRGEVRWSYICSIILGEEKGRCCYGWNHRSKERFIARCKLTNRAIQRESFRQRKKQSSRVSRLEFFCAQFILSNWPHIPQVITTVTV